MNKRVSGTELTRQYSTRSIGIVLLHASQDLVGSDYQKPEMVMFLILFIVLLSAWLFGWAVFHLGRGSIHLRGILAAVSLMRGGSVPN